MKSVKDLRHLELLTRLRGFKHWILSFSASKCIFLLFQAFCARKSSNLPTLLAPSFLKTPCHHLSLKWHSKIKDSSLVYQVLNKCIQAPADDYEGLWILTGNKSRTIHRLDSDPPQCLIFETQGGALGPNRCKPSCIWGKKDILSSLKL